MAGEPTFTLGAPSGPSFARAAQAASFVVGSAARPTFDGTRAEFSEAAGDGDVITGGSSSVTGGEGVGYLGDDAVSDNEARVQIKTPAMTARRLYIHRPIAPGSGCTCTYRLRRNGEDTDLVVTLGAADTSGASQSGKAQSFNAGDLLSIKEVRSGDVADSAVKFTVEVQLTT